MKHELLHNPLLNKKHINEAGWHVEVSELRKAIAAGDLDNIDWYCQLADKEHMYNYAVTSAAFNAFPFWTTHVVVYFTVARKM
jgi:hypothetical protein